ncbi:centrosomal protein of 290 kDa-like [Lineus longissimus]|uniref:centrosomal protein of 290 kDa-like n=1 Tax=Lineus longissimus TaxID=88925 RepID=UPI002B4D53D3
MTIPNIHKCSQLTLENAQMKKKLQKVKQANAELKKELGDIRERLRIQDMMKEYVTTRSTYVQTDPPKSVMSGIYGPPRREGLRLEEEKEKANKLLSMHNCLMKRYEKEVKANDEHANTINSLNLRVTDLEHQLVSAKARVHNLEQEKENTRQGRRRSTSLSPRDPGVLRELDRIKRDRDRQVKENKRLKKELKGLDKGFFDEVEDLKYGLQQSAKLNQEYEKSLKKICSQFGVPFPHPQTVLK